jgi:uncharacterized protein (TIGR02452 family)
MAQQGFRKDQRAKQARATVNKTVPQILASDARARKGVEQAQLFSENTEASSKRTSRNSKTRHACQRSRAEPKDGTNRLGQSSSITAESNQDEISVKIHVRFADTLEAARDLYVSSKSKKNVAILNMASPLRPGGGVLNGATSQEESLCSRTTLLPSLREEWYRLPEVGGIWSPDVLVFRLPGRNGDEELAKANRFYVDVVSSAMIRFPDVIEKPATRGDSDEESEEENSHSIERVYAAQKDRDLALEKMRAVISMLVIQRTERVVLGAWGCGAYGNPMNEICAAWKRAIFGSKSRSVDLGTIKEIVFAIKDARMVHDFVQYWGDEATVEQMDKTDRSSSAANAYDEHVAELAQKIEALELQIAEAKTPMLKQGLEGTLHTLKQEFAKAHRQASEYGEDEED